MAIYFTDIAIFYKNRRHPILYLYFLNI